MRYFLTLTIALMLSNGMVYADEKSAELKPVTVFVHPDAEGKLRILGEVAVVLSGVDQRANRLLGDALAITLMSESVKVIYPAEKELGKERRDMAEPMEFARKIGANCLVTGQVVARCGHCSRGKSSCQNEAVRAVSLALVDVPQDKILLWALYEPKENTSPAALARNFVDLLSNSLQTKDKREESKKEEK